VSEIDRIPDKGLGELLVWWQRYKPQSVVIPVIEECIASRQRIAMLESQLAWIPVSERLPEAPNGTQLGVRYLVLYAGYYHDICVFWPHNKTWTRNDEDKTEDITHWRPLPEPPHECRIQEAQG
jgi:hypothetical protein